MKFPISRAIIDFLSNWFLLTNLFFDKLKMKVLSCLLELE